MNDPWSAIQGAGLGAVVLGIAVWLVKALWEKREKTEEKTELQRENMLINHESRLSVIDKQLTTFQIQLTEAQKDFGRLETTANKLNEKIEGLQKFWREEFEKLSDKMTGGMDRLRSDVRKDFEEHRQLVHDRMGEATRSMISTVEQVMTKQQQRKSK